MCKLSSIEICRTRNHAVIHTDDERIAYIYGEKLGVDFTKLTVDQGYMLVIRYIQKHHAARQIRRNRQELITYMQTHNPFAFAR